VVAEDGRKERVAVNICLPPSPPLEEFEPRSPDRTLKRNNPLRCALILRRLLLWMRLDNTLAFHSPICAHILFRVRLRLRSAYPC
jgi:hypothetical protein